MEVVNFYFEDDINIPLHLYSTMAGVEYVGIPAWEAVRQPTEVRGRKSSFLSRLFGKRSGEFADGQPRTKSIAQAWVGSYANGDLGRLLR